MGPPEHLGECISSPSLVPEFHHKIKTEFDRILSYAVVWEAGCGNLTFRARSQDLLTPRMSLLRQRGRPRSQHQSCPRKSRVPGPAGQSVLSWPFLVATATGIHTVTFGARGWPLSRAACHTEHRHRSGSLEQHLPPSGPL